MTIGERIKARRIELGLTQEEVAFKLGYKSRSSVNKIELSRNPPIKMVEKFAEVLSCEPSYLMGWEDDEEELEEPNEVQGETYAALISRYSKLTDAQRAVVDHLMQSYIGDGTNVDAG